MNKFSFFSFYMKCYAFLGLAAMTPKERRIYKYILTQLAKKGMVRIFEYGSGYSTLYFAKYLRGKRIPFEFHSVDNHQGWHERVKEMVAKEDLNHQVKLHVSVFKPFWDKPNWSWDKAPSCGQFAPSTQHEHDYIHMPQSIKEPFDLIVVDGRFRRRCLQISKQCLSAHGIILIHDAQKKYYQPPADAMAHTRLIDGGKFYPWQRMHHHMWIGSQQPLDKDLC